MEIVREGGLAPLLAMAHAGAGDPDGEVAAAVSNLAAENAEFAAAVFAAGGGRFLCCGNWLAAHDAAGNADIGDEAEGDGSGGGGRDAPFVFGGGASSYFQPGGGGAMFAAAVRWSKAADQPAFFGEISFLSDRDVPTGIKLPGGCEHTKKVRWTPNKFE